MRHATRCYLYTPLSTYSSGVFIGSTADLLLLLQGWVRMFMLCVSLSSAGLVLVTVVCLCGGMACNVLRLWFCPSLVEGQK